MRISTPVSLFFIFFSLIPVCFSQQADKARSGNSPGLIEHIRKDTSKISVNADLSKSNRAYKSRVTDSLLHLLNGTMTDSSRITLLLGLCKEMEQNYAPDDILPYAKKALNMAENLGSNEKYKGSESIGKKLAGALNIVAILYVRKGNVNEGINFLLRAKSVSESIQDKKGMARAYNNLGGCYGAINDLVKATDYNMMSIKIFEELGDSIGLGYNYYHLSSINIKTDNYELALKYGLKALKIRQNINHVKGISESLTNLATIYYNNHNYRKALDFGFKALAFSDSIGSLPEIGNNLNNIANAFSGLGQFNQSLLYFRKAFEVIKLSGDSLNLARAISNLGHAYFLSKDYLKAVAILEPNIDALKHFEQKEVLETTYKILTSCDSALGNFKGALFYAGLYKDALVERMNNERMIQLDELLIKYESDKRQKDNEALQLQNEVQALELMRSKYLLLGLIPLLILGSVTLLLITREKKLRAERKALLLEQRLLRLQMNPHFIFNSLQAIQNYVLRHNQLETIRYLNMFAGLTREVLENSRVETIPLEREISLLKNYLQLQKLRFDERFDFEIHLQDIADTKTIFVPPMLSQPFIENAVEHGLKNVESGGRIDIYFRTKENVLFMTIVDNGEGLKEGDTADKGHVSLAIDITRERIALINKKDKPLASFSVSPAFENEPYRKGVKVSFQIPFKTSFF